MTRTEHRILSYPHLSPEEQREVEAYVDEHPEWAALLDDVRSLQTLAEAVQREQDASRTASVLAVYVVGRHLAPDDASTELQEAFADMEARLQDDEVLRRRAEAMQDRVEEAEAAVNPRQHFETLTGQEVAAGPAVPDETIREVAESSPPPREPTGESRSSGEIKADRAPDRAPATGAATMSRPARWAMAAVVLVAAVYGLLYAASWSTQSTAQQLAVMNVNTDVIESYQTRVRSPMPQAASDTTPDALYLEALPLLRDARTSTLGLFPHFDQRKLKEAETLLHRVLEKTPDGSFLQLEAYFHLGKINLAQGEVETARGQFKEVVRREGRRATEAYRILRELEEARSRGAAADASLGGGR